MGKEADHFMGTMTELLPKYRLHPEHSLPYLRAELSGFQVNALPEKNTGRVQIISDHGRRSAESQAFMLLSLARDASLCYTGLSPGPQRAPYSRRRPTIHGNTHLPWFLCSPRVSIPSH